jgi:hypothetical protein
MVDREAGIKTTYLLRTRTSTLMPEMKATSFLVFATRIPICQSASYPGAVRALKEREGGHDQSQPGEPSLSAGQGLTTTRTLWNN